MPVRTALGAVVKARRIELGWTQEALAERISADGEYVRQSEISRIENGKIALPRRDRLERIAHALDLPLGELLARSGWAGAEPHFPEPSDELLVLNLVPEDGLQQRGGAVAVDSVRRTLAAMREQSDRPQRDRQIIDDVERQLLQLVDEPLHARTEQLSSNADG